MLWAVFAVIDFPLSLIYMIVGKSYYHFLQSLGDSPLAYILYLPHLVHGFLGTLWWYFLPRLVMPRRFGGIWGASK
jgi:hypothetical protein